ncbi:MAG: hypothetical protein ACI4TI_00380 [Christensenellales bacterium]
MEDKKKTKSQIICDAVCGIIMILAIISYLIVGFVTNIWHPTWLIFVVSALLCGIVGIVSNTASDLKKLSKDEQSKQNSDE